MNQKERAFNILNDFIFSNIKEILVPSEEYEYGDSLLPTAYLTNYDELVPIINNINVSVFRGATKIVLIPAKENFVIKLNITGTYLTESECQNFGFDFPTVDRHSEQDILDEEVALYDGLSKTLQNFIKPNLYIGEFKGIPVYIQEKIKIDYEKASGAAAKRFKEESEEVRNSIKILESKSRPAGWTSSIFPAPFLNDMVNFYGEQRTEEIISQLKESSIYDFNWGNFGYDLNDRPCLFDIGGFDEEEFFC